MSGQARRCWYTLYRQLRGEVKIIYALKIYEGDTLDEILYFRSEEKVEAKARELAQQEVDDNMRDWTSPESYGFNSWEEYINHAVKIDGALDDVFRIEEIEFED